MGPVTYCLGWGHFGGCQLTVLSQQTGFLVVVLAVVIVVQAHAAFLLRNHKSLLVGDSVLRGFRVEIFQPGKCVNVRRREAQIVDGRLGPRVHPFALVIAVGGQPCRVSGSITQLSQN